MKDVQTDSEHTLLVAKVCTILKKIIRFQNLKPICYMLNDRRCKIV